MPNYCNNELLVWGKKTDVESLFEGVESKTSVFDFQKIAPMPESIKQTIHGSVGFVSEAAWIYQKQQKITNYMEWLMERNEWRVEKLDLELATYAEKGFVDYELGERIVKNRQDYEGCGDWYEWSMKHWGSKWDACDAMRDGNLIVFETAWSPSLPVILKLSEQNPNVMLDLIYQEEGCGILGIYSCLGGKVEYHEDFSSKSEFNQAVRETLAEHRGWENQKNVTGKEAKPSLVKELTEKKKQVKREGNERSKAVSKER